MTDEGKQLIAYHEAGHGILVPETDQRPYRARYLLNRIPLMLGGRAAEKLILDYLTNGAANDLK